MMPSSRATSTSTVGLPRESRISRATTASMLAIVWYSLEPRSGPGRPPGPSLPIAELARAAAGSGGRLAQQRPDPTSDADRFAQDLTGGPKRHSYVAVSVTDSR